MARTRRGRSRPRRAAAIRKIPTVSSTGAKPFFSQEVREKNGKFTPKPGRPKLQGFRKNGKVFDSADSLTLKGLEMGKEKFTKNGKTFVFE